MPGKYCLVVVFIAKKFDGSLGPCPLPKQAGNGLLRRTEVREHHALCVKFTPFGRIKHEFYWEIVVARTLREGPGRPLRPYTYEIPCATNRLRGHCSVSVRSELDRR